MFIPFYVIVVLAGTCCLGWGNPVTMIGIFAVLAILAAGWYVGPFVLFYAGLLAAVEHQQGNLAELTREEKDALFWYLTHFGWLRRLPLVGTKWDVSSAIRELSTKP